MQDLKMRDQKWPENGGPTAGRWLLTKPPPSIQCKSTTQPCVKTQHHYGSSAYRASTVHRRNSVCANDTETWMLEWYHAQPRQDALESQRLRILTFLHENQSSLFFRQTSLRVFDFFGVRRTTHLHYWWASLSTAHSSYTAIASSTCCPYNVHMTFDCHGRILIFGSRDPNLVRIPGNEKACRCSCKVITLPICHSDEASCHRHIMKLIFDEWQVIWSCCAGNKLHAIKPTVDGYKRKTCLSRVIQYC